MMMQETIYIKKIAVLGAGVMGAQIAAHCVNAGIETLLFDLAAEKGDHNGIVNKAIAQLKKLKPSPLGTPGNIDKLIACNYDDHLSDLTSCDLIIEAIGEKMAWKKALYHRISPYLNPNAILVSNTSGLSINALAEEVPDNQRARFCGVHFFNPPRYMHLAELIPAKTTTPALIDFLESWLTSYLGKGVVRAKDTPNFIANRIGVFSLLATLHHADAYGLGLDEVDALTGSLLGRPKSATFRTMDVVGLDTMHHVVETMSKQLSQDPWHHLFMLPDWLMQLINKGNLGQKSGQGIYRKIGKKIEVYDVGLNDYRLSGKGVSAEVNTIMAIKNAQERMQQLIDSTHPQACFLVACFRDLFHYTAYHLNDIAHSVCDVDLALRFGFGWQQGPFEVWQDIGLNLMKGLITTSIETESTLARAPLPHWLNALEHFYIDGQAYSPVTGTFIGRSQLPVYQRQLSPVCTITSPKPHHKIIFENEGVYLWHLQDDVAVISFKTKANTIGQSVLDGINQAIDRAEKDHLGLIMHQQDANNFSSGADLRQILGLIQKKQFTALASMVECIQQVALRLKYSPIPTVAAIRGRVLGGGCELMMQCDAIVAAFESYPGLVEVGVGFIPAGSGSKAFAKRAAMRAQGGDVMPYVQKYFEQIATATVAASAADAMHRGFLRRQDHWVMHADEVLYAALAKVKSLQAMNYIPPVRTRFQVAGLEGKARLQVGLINWLEGGFISQHDYFIGNQLANVLCGGEVNAGTLVDDAWILKLEKEAFMTLAETPETEARIAFILETGKPLRN